MSHWVTSSTLQLVRLAGLRGDIEGEGLDAVPERGGREGEMMEKGEGGEKW